METGQRDREREEREIQSRVPCATLETNPLEPAFVEGSKAKHIAELTSHRSDRQVDWLVVFRERSILQPLPSSCTIEEPN